MSEADDQELALLNSTSRSELEEDDGEPHKLGPRTPIEVRHQFIRKVFTVFVIELAAACLLAYPLIHYMTALHLDFPYSHYRYGRRYRFRDYHHHYGLLRNIGLMLPYLLLFLVIAAGIKKFDVNGRIPKGCIVTIFLSILKGFTVGIFCVDWNTYWPFICMIATAAITFPLIIFSLQTKYDFNGQTPYLLVTCISVGIFVLVLIYISHMLLFSKFCTVLIALSFSAFTVYHTQMISTGQNQESEHTVNDYVDVANKFYIDFAKFIFSGRGNLRVNGGDAERLGPDVHIIVRHGFIRKVFSIVAIMLIVTSLIAFPFVYYAPTFHAWMQDGGKYVFEGLFYLYIVFLGSSSFYVHFIHRTYPWNYVYLVCLTIMKGLLVGAISAQYQTSSIIACAAGTAAMVVLLIIFASQTKYDFAKGFPYLLVFAVVMMLFGLVLMFLPLVPWLHKLYSCLMVLFITYMFIFNIQRIVGGRHQQFAFSVDDYILAAIYLYQDIVNLFILILQIFGRRSRHNTGNDAIAHSTYDNADYNHM